MDRRREEGMTCICNKGRFEQKQDVEKGAFSFISTERRELGLRLCAVGMRPTASCLFTSSHRFNELFKIQRANIQT